MYVVDMSSTLTPQTNCSQNRGCSASTSNDTFLTPKDQELRNMRYHVHCQDLNGVIGYYP